MTNNDADKPCSPYSRFPVPDQAEDVSRGNPCQDQAEKTKDDRLDVRRLALCCSRMDHLAEMGVTVGRLVSKCIMENAIYQ
jgi:hypothetical protein